LTLVAQSSAEILEWLNAGGVVGLLVLIVAGSLRGWWVPGRTHDRVVAERDRFLELATRSTVATEQATKVMQAQQDVAQEIAEKAAREALARAREEGAI
jgi:hypothetical protein